MTLNSYFTLNSGYPVDHSRCEISYALLTVVLSGVWLSFPIYIATHLECECLTKSSNTRAFSQLFYTFCLLLPLGYVGGE